MKPSDNYYFLRRYILHKETDQQKNYINTLQNLYTHTIEMQHIMFIILVTSSPISSSIFISFVFYQKVTHYWQLWLLLTIICHYNTRACVYLETLFVTLYDNG